jgi:taurine dioxygenase
MRVQSLTPHMGAEIFDVRLSAVTPGQVKAVRQLLVEHMALVFRDQELSRDEHKAFGRQFGELHVHPSKRELGARGDPEIFAVKTTPDSRFTNGEGWHSDVSCDAVPPMGSMLFVRELPGPSGGDTLFANLSLAYETLSEPMQTWLRSLTAVHDGVKDLRAYDIRLQPGQSYPHAEHPVVVRHPDSGREVLFVNRSFTERIVGLRTLPGPFHPRPRGAIE